MGQIGYANRQLINGMHEFLVGKEFQVSGGTSQEYDLRTTFAILKSYSRLAPDDIKYFDDFASHLHTNLSEVNQIDKAPVKKNSYMIVTKIPDLVMFMDIWLIMVKFAAMQPNYKQMTTMSQNFQLII